MPCIFFRLSSSGLVLGPVVRLAGEAEVLTAGREKVRGAWVVGGFSAAVSEVVSRKAR